VLTYGKRNSGIRLTAFVMSSVFFVYKINFRSFDSATAPAVRPLAASATAHRFIHFTKSAGNLYRTDITIHNSQNRHYNYTYAELILGIVELKYCMNCIGGGLLPATK
jgi:hypothetical protein